MSLPLRNNITGTTLLAIKNVLTGCDEIKIYDSKDKSVDI
jgi:hypothetical protein